MANKARELYGSLPLGAVGLQRLTLFSQRVRHHMHPVRVVHVADEIARPLLSLGHILLFFVLENVLVYGVVTELL